MDLSFELDLPIAPAVEAAVEAAAATAVVLDGRAYRAGAIPASPLMPNAIPIPGMLHVLDNMMREADQSLQQWPSFWEQVRNITNLLCHRLPLESLVAEMDDVDPPAWTVANRRLFNRPLQRPYDKRWGSCTSFLRTAKPLLHVLRDVWSYQRAPTETVPARAAGTGEADYELDGCQLAETLSSNFFLRVL